MIVLTTNEQIKLMQHQLNSTDADFSLLEKMMYMAQCFDSDPAFSQEARDIVRGNIAATIEEAR